MMFSLGQSMALASLLVFCSLAVIFDLRARRIPNALSVAALVIGLSLRVPHGWESLGWGLTAAFAAFVFGFVFFLLGGLGGGDVKLLAGLASFLEPIGLVVGLAVMAVTGGVMALTSVIRARRVKSTGTNLALFFVTLGKASFSGWKGESPMASLSNHGGASVTNPYAIAICLGALTGWITPFLGWTP
jgi:prepilin peptidase CpaA